MAKTNSTGTYTSLCDGTAPSSPLLSDGVAVYTPGLSEQHGGGSTFYSNDKQGNLWTLNAANGGQTFHQDTTAFGTPTASAYSSLTPFKFGGGNGCRTDSDTGLVLMGYRYYDSRIGRFITQDPAGDGDNWYAYAGNNPVNDIDPSGLSTPLYHNLGGDFADGTGQMGIGSSEGFGFWQKEQDGEMPWTWSDTHHLTPDIENTVWGPWSDWHYIPQDNGFEMGTKGGGFAGNNQLGPKGSLYRTDIGEGGGPDMHIYHDGDPLGPETNIDQNGRVRTGLHRGRLLKELPEKLKEPYCPIIETFLKKCGMGAVLLQDALEGIVGDIPMVFFYTPNLNYKGSKNNPVRNAGA